MVTSEGLILPQDRKQDPHRLERTAFSRRVIMHRERKKKERGNSDNRVRWSKNDRRRKRKAEGETARDRRDLCPVIETQK